MDKVLLINDCKFESIIMKDILCNFGYDIKITNEYEAYDMIKRFIPDIVIANLIMKTISGDELINNIKRRNPEIRCILSSCNPIKLDDYKDKKVDDIIHTPIDKEKLKKVLVKEENAFVFCPYCGKKLEGTKGFTFCYHCGNKLK